MDAEALLAQNKKALLAIQELKSQLAQRDAKQRAPLAIVGMACRFPGGCRSPQDLWQLLCDGRDAVGDAFAARWPEELYDADPARPGTIMTRGLGMIDDAADFDPELFHISPREAAAMDPQQRLLLQVAWEACEDAGLSLPRLHGTSTGIFLGLGNNDYGDFELRSDDLQRINAHSGTGNAAAMAAGRLAFFLGTQGPALVSDTACSSALVAVHQAITSLRQGETDLALAGGVNLVLRPNGSVFLSRIGALSPTGRCRAFAEGADGYVRADGCGVIALKRLDDAVRDGDRVWAVLRGSALNHDGRSGGLTVPNGAAQRALITQALRNAGVAADKVSYLEAHGTGTPLGDPIEMRAIAAVFGQRSSSEPLFVGSVKSNLGHTEAAAGIAGLIKAALCLHHRAIPAHLHFARPSAHIDWDIPVRVPTELQPWQSEGPRFAGVSSFGFSGTNAHVILEEAPRRAATVSGAPRPQLLCLSASHPRSLEELAGAYQQLVEGAAAHDAPIDLPALCHASTHRRSNHRSRVALLAEDREQLARDLRSVTEGLTPPGAARGEATLDAMAKVAFILSGQGSQWIGMGRDLLDDEPVFAAALEAMDHPFRAEQGWSLVEELRAGPERSQLARTKIAQPAIVAVQLALAELWRSWGVQPDAVLGHSLGEISAAQLAGAFDRDAALRLAARRGAVMDAATGGGKMAEVTCTEADARALLRGLERDVAIAAINSASSVVLAGTVAALEEALARAAAAQLRHRMLRVDYAFHSPQIAALAEPLRQALGEVKPRPGQLALYSSVRGEALAAEQLTTAYWLENMTAPVRFHAAAQAMVRDGYRVFVEIAPHPVLLAALRDALGGHDAVAVSSLRREAPARRELLAQLAQLHVAGVPIQWSALYASPDPANYAANYAAIELPRYPWRNRRFWTEVTAQHGAPTANANAEPDEDQPQQSPLWRELAELAAPARRARIERHVRERVTAVLRLDPDTPLPKRTLLNELGMDSATAVELSRALPLTREHRISPTALFDHPTVDALTNFLVAEHERLQPSVPVAAPPTAAAPVPAPAPDSADNMLDLLAAFEKEYS